MNESQTDNDKILKNTIFTNGVNTLGCIVYCSGNDYYKRNYKNKNTKVAIKLSYLKQKIIYRHRHPRQRYSIEL